MGRQQKESNQQYHILMFAQSVGDKRKQMNNNFKIGDLVNYKDEKTRKRYIKKIGMNVTLPGKIVAFHTGLINTIKVLVLDLNKEIVMNTKDLIKVEE